MSKHEHKFSTTLHFLYNQAFNYQFWKNKIQTRQISFLFQFETNLQTNFFAKCGKLFRILSEIDSLEADKAQKHRNRSGEQLRRKSE